MEKHMYILKRLLIYLGKKRGWGKMDMKTIMEKNNDGVNLVNLFITNRLKQY
jgi:hypothetical protein